MAAARVRGELSTPRNAGHIARVDASSANRDELQFTSHPLRHVFLRSLIPFAALTSSPERPLYTPHTAIMIGGLQIISRTGRICRPISARQALVAPRALHTSTPRLASEVPSDPLQDPEFRSFFEKVRAHQPALDAMMKIGKIMQEKGTC